VGLRSHADPFVVASDLTKGCTSCSNKSMDYHSIGSNGLPTCSSNDYNSYNDWHCFGEEMGAAFLIMGIVFTSIGGFAVLLVLLVGFLCKLTIWRSPKQYGDQTRQPAHESSPKSQIGLTYSSGL
jgi:hypothetical protein